LRSIAGCLRSTLERAGDLVARFGGEEFVILMPRTNLAQALLVAELLRSQVERLRLEHAGNCCQIVTISVGCSSTIPVANGLPNTLIEAADRCLYAAKAAGRNRVAPARTDEELPLPRVSAS
jgi:diguanylate cyclase (GGDEF)-like protein